MIEDHKTQTIRYAYERFVELWTDQYTKWLRNREVTEEDRRHFDESWRLLMRYGAEGFFLDETTVPDDDVEVEIVNFFIWCYERDGWTNFRPYWKVLRVTWRNYKAMGLDIFFENTEGYGIARK